MANQRQTKRGRKPRTDNKSHSKKRERAKQPRENAAQNKNFGAVKRAEQADSKAAATPPKKKSEQEQRQGVIKWLIETLKRVIGYKKGERDEFRYNEETEHPNYIFEKSSKKYRAMGLTHSNETFGDPNMPLKNNPDPTDEKTAYIRNGIIQQKGRMSKNCLKQLSFSAEDMANVKSKKRNYRKIRKTAAYQQRQAKKKKGK